MPRLGDIFLTCMVVSFQGENKCFVGTLLRVNTFTNLHGDDYRAASPAEKSAAGIVIAYWSKTNEQKKGKQTSSSLFSFSFANDACITMS